MQYRWLLITLILGLALIGQTGVLAQSSPTAPPSPTARAWPAAAAGPRAPALALPPTPQFDFLGFIQEASLDRAFALCTPPIDPTTGAPSQRLAGGTMTVNGIKMTVPCNTILQLPANSMTWADLFDPARAAPVSDPSRPAGAVIGTVPVHAASQTGLALADYPMPFPSFEVRVQGNVVNGQYVVGLIAPITQQGLNASSGLISYIDYTIGTFRVGGIPNDPACVSNGITSPLCSGALVQINDPDGRWGLAHSPDPRFTSDTSWPTVHAATGFPVCIPRFDPATQDDPECPRGNRPLNGDPRFPIDPFLAVGVPLKIFEMRPPPGRPGADPSGFPDPRKQVPMMVGDQVNYAGTLYRIDPSKTMTVTLPGGGTATIPDNTAANTYLSAHTVEDVLGIFTAPGVNPAYVSVEAILIGTSGAAVQGIRQEASSRLTVVGFTTDPTRRVEIKALDVNPCTGAETERRLATTDPASQPVRGRFVHAVLGGLFMPPTREYVVRLQNGDYKDGSGNEIPVANGLLSGRYTLPNFDFIFPENHRLGEPIIPFNFQDIPFIAEGSGPLDGTGAIVGALEPWPGTVAPQPMNCTVGGTAPVVDAGPNIAASTGSSVFLTGRYTRDPGSRNATVLWSQLSTDPVQVTLANPTDLTARFTAPNVTTATLTFQLSVSDQFGTGVDSVTITVFQQTDTVQVLPSSWSPQAGGFGILSVTATSTDPSAQLRLTEIAQDATTVEWGTGAANLSLPGTFNWRELKGAPRPASLLIHSTKGGSYTATCGLPNTRGDVTCQ